MAYNSDNDKVIQEIVISERKGDYLRVTETGDSVDVRKWYTDDDDNVKPGKGIRLSKEMWWQIIETIANACEGADEKPAAKKTPAKKAVAKKAVKPVAKKKKPATRTR